MWLLWQNTWSVMRTILLWSTQVLSRMGRDWTKSIRLDLTNWFQSKFWVRSRILRSQVDLWRFSIWGSCDTLIFNQGENGCFYIMSYLLHLLWLSCHWEYSSVKGHVITYFCFMLFKPLGHHNFFFFSENWSDFKRYDSSTEYKRLQLRRWQWLESKPPWQCHWNDNWTF